MTEHSADSSMRQRSHSYSLPRLSLIQSFLSRRHGQRLCWKTQPGNKQQIETLLRSFRDRTGIEIAVVTISFDDMQSYPIGDYTSVGRAWVSGVMPRSGPCCFWSL
jgi:hypothetical protein